MQAEFATRPQRAVRVSKTDARKSVEAIPTV
jgi:hypothetical protein